jgi:ubiquinone/menaquinone biosynthesis C-methylase UbiE
MKRVIQILAGKPVVLNILRRFIESNYITLKKVIRTEFSLNQKNAGSLSTEKILDVPCGTGEFCMLFDQASYYGLDISEKYIDYARKKYKGRFFCGDATKSGFDSDYFDKILIVGFLHHLDASSVDLALKEAKRILKRDGILLLIEDAPTSSAWNVVGKVLQKFDIGSNIRPGSEYRNILERYFTLGRYYPVQSGFWDYSVFVLSRDQDSL